MGNKVIPEYEVLAAIRKIEKIVQSGWSLSYARNKACGHSYAPLFKAVSTHPSYPAILVAYAKRKNFSNQYIEVAKSKLHLT